MRMLVLAVTAVTTLALTAVTAFTAGAPTDPIQKPRVSSGGVAGNPQGGFLRGSYDKLAKGDMTGSGGGAMMGGMMGDMMGSMGMGGGRR
jgi:hypothetical protein